MCTQTSVANPGPAHSRTHSGRYVLSGGSDGSLFIYETEGSRHLTRTRPDSPDETKVSRGADGRSEMLTEDVGWLCMSAYAAACELRPVAAMLATHHVIMQHTCRRWLLRPSCHCSKCIQPSDFSNYVRVCCPQVVLRPPYHDADTMDEPEEPTLVEECKRRAAGVAAAAAAAAAEEKKATADVIPVRCFSLYKY